MIVIYIAYISKTSLSSKNNESDNQKIYSSKKQSGILKQNTGLTHNHNLAENMVVDRNAGEVICSICGRVLVDKYQYSIIEQYFTNDSHEIDASRSSLRMYDGGLSTVMSPIGRDASGKSLTSDIKDRFYRLRALDNQSKSKFFKGSLVKSYLLLDAVKTKMAIPDMVAEKAAYIFRKSIIKKINQARNYPSVMLASLYAACKQTNTPRTMHEISVAGDIKKRRILQAYQVLIAALNLRFEPYHPSEFVTRLCTAMNLNEKTRRAALDILSKVKGEIFYGKNPMSLAAAAVYIACKDNREKTNQLKIAALAGISNVSLRNMYFLLKGNIT